MMETIFRRASVWERMASGHLGIILPEFAMHMHGSGYQPNTIRFYCRAVEHFGQWLATGGVTPKNLTEKHRHEFLFKHLRRYRCQPPAAIGLQMCRPSLELFFNYLRRRGCLQLKANKLRPTQIDRMVASFDDHLLRVRGLALSTRQGRQRYVRTFLEWRFGRRRLAFKQITAGQIHQFLIEHTSGWKPASVRDLTVALRSFFRFLEFGNLAKAGLSRYVPHPCPWPLSQPPRTLRPEEQERFLKSFDRRVPAGKRDYAIALCCAELGLRACEVASLTLEDIDWRALTLRVQYTKQRRERLLPLPGKTARAIASYLQSGRPHTISRSLFVRHRFPVGQPLRADGLRDTMSRGFERAGMTCTGTHILRHTWATRALRRGHTLKQIADILGHLSINTTSRYAHLHIEELRQAALPWPRTGE